MPSSAIEKYRTSWPWSDFKEIVALEGTENDDNKTEIDSQIVGEWEFLWVTPYKSYRMTHVEFKSDGTFSYTSTNKPDYEEHGIFKIEGDILYQKFSDEDDWELSRIKNLEPNYLTLIGLSDDGLSELRELYFHRDIVGESDVTLTGTWLGCFVNNESNKYKQWIFNPDGTGSMTEWFDIKDQKTETFTYTLTDTTITIDWGDGSPEIYDYSISGTTLTLSRFEKSWKYYKQDVISGVLSIKADKYKSQIYSIGGKKLNALTKGINIIRMNDGTIRKVIIR